MNKIKKIIKTVACIVVLLAMILILIFQNRDRDFMKFGAGKADKTQKKYGKNATAEEFMPGNIAPVDDMMGYITPSGFSLIDVNGEKIPAGTSDDSPNICSNGEFCICYSSASKYAYVCKKDSLRYEINTDNRIIRAKVNENGYSYVVTGKEGYSCEIMVYNKNGEAIFRWDYSKNEFLDADINYDNNKIVVSTVSSNQDKLQTEIELIDLAEAKVIRKKTVNSTLVYLVKFMREGAFVAVGSDRLLYFNNDSTIKWIYKYSGRELLNIDIDNKDIFAIAFLEAGSGVKGNSTEVEVVNRIGKKIASKKLSGVVEDIDTGKNIIAMAIGKEIIITDKNLKTEKTLSAASTIKKMELFSDNEHLFVMENSLNEILK